MRILQNLCVSRFACIQKKPELGDPREIGAVTHWARDDCQVVAACLDISKGLKGVQIGSIPADS